MKYRFCDRCGKRSDHTLVCDECTTDEDLDRMIAEQRLCLPPWWERHERNMLNNAFGTQRIVRLIKTTTRRRRGRIGAD